MKHPDMQLAWLHTSPAAQLVPFERAVQPTVLVAGWQLRQGFVELVAPGA
jgi:hypothetical protein